MPPDNSINIDVNKVIEIIKEENPQVFELAVRRAVIEHQNEVIAGLREQLDPQQVTS